jgi:hypothetical protein
LCFLKAGPWSCKESSIAFLRSSSSSDEVMMMDYSYEWGRD